MKWGSLNYAGELSGKDFEVHDNFKNEIIGCQRPFPSAAVLGDRRVLHM